MKYQEVTDYFSQHEDEMLETIELLVTTETPSDDKPRLDAFAELLAGRLRAAGAEVEILPVETQGNHVRARFGQGDYDDDVKPALILCHYDTVWPVGSLETHPYRIEEDGKGYGPGIFDMQSSLMLVRVRTARRPRSGVGVAPPGHHSDDVGRGSGQPHLAGVDRGGGADAPSMRWSWNRPCPAACSRRRARAAATSSWRSPAAAAHAGVEPERGISAVHEMAHQILKIQALTDWEKGTTVNVNVVQGGTKSNVIPAKAVASVDMRAWTQDEVDRVVAAMYGLEPILPGAVIEVSGGANRPPLERAVTGALYRTCGGIGA